MNQFNSPLTLSSYKSIITIGLILAIISIVALVLYPNFQDLQLSRQRVEEKKMEIEIEKKYLASLSRAKDNLKNYPEEVEMIESALPDNPAIPSLLNFISNISSISGISLIKIDSFKTQPSKDFPELEETVINLEFLGSYSGLKRLLGGKINSIESSSRLIKVENIYFSTEKEEDEFIFKLELKVYSYTKI